MGRTARIILGLALSVAASGAALACERAYPCEHRDGLVEDRYGPPVHHYEREAYRDPYGWREPAPPCRTACGEISLPESFFAGGGGVGPIPAGPDYGGVYVVVRGGGFAGARAFASSSASAAASTRVSVRVFGGGRSGGCCH